MTQQINLYQPMFRKQRVVFSARTTLALALGFVALLLGWWLLTGHQVDRLADQLADQRELEQRLSDRIARLRDEIEGRTADPLLVDSVERLRTRVNSLERSERLMRDRMPAERARVSARLVALDEAHPSGLWLTTVAFGRRGDEFEFAGRVLGASLVPAYLERIGRQEVFTGAAFRHLVLQPQEDELPGLAFRVSTESPEPDR